MGDKLVHPPDKPAGAYALVQHSLAVKLMHLPHKAAGVHVTTHLWGKGRTSPPVANMMSFTVVQSDLCTMGRTSPVGPTL